MTDIYTNPYEQSYPPSILTGGPPPAADPLDYTSLIVAKLGAGEKQATVFATVASLNASPTIGKGGSVNLTGDPAIVAKMQTGAYVLLGTGQKAYNDGAEWKAGGQPGPTEVPGLDDDHLEVEHPAHEGDDLHLDLDDDGDVDVTITAEEDEGE
jgi:hypothetical protein